MTGERSAVTRSATAAVAKAGIIADFRAAMGELKCIGSERLVRQGISMTQLHVMHMLERHGEMAMSRLAELLDVSALECDRPDRPHRRARLRRADPRPERPAGRPRPDHGPAAARSWKRWRRFARRCSSGCSDDSTRAQPDRSARGRDVRPARGDRHHRRRSELRCQPYARATRKGLNPIMEAFPATPAMIRPLDSKRTPPWV